MGNHGNHNDPNSATAGRLGAGAGRPSLPEPEDPLYHGAGKESIARIATQGLVSNLRVRNDWGEGRGEDYDRPVEEELIYFTRHDAREWGGTQLRLSEYDLPNYVSVHEDTLRPGEYYASAHEEFSIPPEAIEYLTPEGTWRPLTEHPAAASNWWHSR